MADEYCMLVENDSIYLTLLEVYLSAGNDKSEPRMAQEALRRLQANHERLGAAAGLEVLKRLPGELRVADRRALVQAVFKSNTERKRG